jgi:hypothetical protein
MVVQGFQEMTRGDDVTGIPQSLFPGDSSVDMPPPLPLGARFLLVYLDITGPN